MSGSLHPMVNPMVNPVVHAVVPAGLDDPRRPSGGNVFDRRVLDGLRARGWAVHEHPVPLGDGAALERVLGAPEPGAPVLVDGLVATAAPGAVVAGGGRTPLVVLAHMCFADADPATAAPEAAVLGAARAVVATSGWTAERLREWHHLPDGLVHVVEPGVDPAGVAPGSASGGALLCVAAVTPAKGHDVLVTALAAVADLGWRCTWVGALDLDPGFVDGVRADLVRHGLAGRVRLVGPLTGAALAQAYDEADLLVHPSRHEGYGMVVTEALARGVPVLAARVGGVPRALGDVDGAVPGLLVPDGDPAALAGALRGWLADPGLRAALRATAAARRGALRPWSASVAGLAAVLHTVAGAGPAEPGVPHLRTRR